MVATAVVLVLVAAVYHVPRTSSGAPLPAGKLDLGLSLREFGLVSLAGGVWALFNVGYIVLVSFGPPLLIAQGVSASEAGFATSLAAWTIIVTIALGGILLDRIGHATALMITSFAVLGPSIMLMPFASSLVLIAFIGAVAGVPCGAMVALPAEGVCPRGRGPGMGVFFTWYYVGMALLTPVAGLVRDLTCDLGAPLIFAGVFGNYGNCVFSLSPLFPGSISVLVIASASR